jgi:tRNA (guanine-N7-)-methyltransferase
MSSPASKRQRRSDYLETRKKVDGGAKMPKKRYYRQRAHANPFSDHALS